MSSLKPNTAGVYDIPSANIDTLYIKGKKFQDYITELVFEDQLEQSEITEIKLLLEYLDTTGLNSAWTVTNSNVNETLRSAITALQTKLAQIDTTALSQSSVLTNDNRNSVLKTAIDTATSDLTALTTRVTTAEGDIDNVENKTKYITTSTTAEIPGLSGVTPAYIKIRPFETDEPIRAIDLFVNPDELTDRGYLVAPVGRQTYMRMIGTANMTSLSQPQYNKIEMQTNRFSLEANDIKITCNPLGLNVSLGEISVPGTIRIGAKSDTIEIGTEPPNPLFENKINIGVVGFPTKSITSIKGFLNVAGCEWVLPKSDKFGLETLIAFIPTAGLPAWVLSFALGSSIPSFEYSDVFVMKDGATGVNKSGEVTTSNEPKVKSLVVFNRDLNIARLTPIEGTFVASGTISKTTLNGSIRNSVFLDGGGDNKIAFKHHNIAATDITEWATTEGNDKCNVFEIGGNSGILLHQGAANAGTDIKIINSKAGNIVLKVGTGGGIKADTKDSFTVLHDANYPGAAIGRLSPQAFATDETARTNNPIARLEIDCIANRKGIRLFGYDPAQPFTLAPDETNLTNQLINTPAITTTTATTTSLVINGNYTGNTDARLYKNADNKLMWNGAEVGAGGVSSGGITYMINVASNITNPDPTPTETTMTAAYSGNAQRTITQAISAHTAYYIAKYTTEVFDEASNPVLTGLQQLNQYLMWNSQNQVGQIYGRLWFQATAVGSATLYQRTYASPITTTAATLINGTPIPTPKGLYNIKFQRVVFPNINVVVSNGPVVLRFRVEGYDLLNGWTTLATMAGGAPEYLTTPATNLTITLNEAIDLNQTSAVGGKTALRLVLFISSGTGTISQTSAGGADLGAYSLIAVGANTPGLFRTMLYDGTNAKINTPYSTTPTLIEYDLAIDAPYNVSAFPQPTLSTDLYFIQPSGGFANHAITLYFNEGTISHYHSTISPTQTTPTLSQVLNSGATASQAINMNTNKISGITALEGASDGNWNVKEITAGTNISVSSTTANYTITNNAPTQDVAAGTGIQIAKNGATATITNNAATQDVAAGTGIQIAKTGTTATITNNAPTQDVAGGTGIQIAKNGSIATITNNAAVQNLTAGEGVSISIDTPTRNATITNSGVLSVSAGTGISVSTTNGVATITNTNVGATAVAVATTTRDEHETLMEVGALPRKPDYWGANWNVAGGSFGRHLDIYVSIDGKVIVSAIHSSGIKRNTNYGIGDFTISAPIVDAPVITTVCGTSSGSRLFAFGFYVSQTLVQSLAFFSSIDSGLNWSRITSSTFTGLTQSDRVRCSGDGTYILASDSVQIAGARFLISTDGGATWTRRTLNESLASGNTRGVAISRSGAVQFILYVNNAQTDSRIFQSLDYGATFSEVLGHVPGAYWNRIESDATGRFVYATRFESVNAQTTAVYRSENYGASGSWVLAGMNSIEDIWVSATGQFVAGVSAPNININNDRFLAYSVDYGRTVQVVNLGNTTLFRTINGSADGSVLVLGSSNETEGNPSYTGDGLIRIARQGQQNIQDLNVLGGTLTKVGGVYTIATDELWFSGGFEIQNPQSKIDFDFLSAGKIDLTQFNIRYEIECYWNTGTWSYIYPLLAINDVRNIDLGVNENGLSYDPLSGLTNWTNHINNGVYGGAEEYNQTYRNRFFVGYFPGSTTNSAAPPNDQIRQRSLIKGTLSLHRRPTGQTGIVDASPNARDILNIFTCDNYATRFSSGMSYLLNSSVQQGTDYGVNHQRINGTGIFPAEPVWSYNALGAGSQIQAGVFRLGFHLSEGGTTTLLRPRAAHFVYRIYRERK